MDSYLAGIKPRMFSRVATTLIAFTFSLAFIYILTSITPGTGLAGVVNVGGGANGQHGGSKSVAASLQTCPGGTRGSQALFSAAEAKYASLAEDKFTIAMLTYKRPKELSATLTALLAQKIPSLHEIVVVWNDLENMPPSGFVSQHGVNVRYRRSPVNSLNQKLWPDPEYTTKAILLSDDDVYYHPADLEFVFQTWRRFGQNRLTGALARCAVPAKGDKWKYGFCSTKKEDADYYNMIITNLSFVHIAFLDYYSSHEPSMVAIRRYIDERLNCEDIALNYVTSMLTCSGPLQVKGRKPYYNSSPANGISHKAGHLEARTKCLNDFSNLLGFMPLINETVRIEKGVLVSNV